MTKEELRKEATTTVQWKCTPMIDRTTFVNGYITGAEPREKRIAKLEQKLEQTEKDLADYQFNYPTIKELEKENAELKQKLKALEGQTPWKDIKDKSEVIGKLTEAKGIIEELSKSLFLAKGIVRDLIDDTVDFKESKERAIYCYEQESFDTYKEAEQFLKEVSE